MHRSGHVGVALAFYAPVAFVTAALAFPDLTLLGGLGVVGLAMLPDIDLWLPFVAHRGPTHTVWFALLIAGGGGVVGWTAGGAASPLVAVGLAAFGATVGGLTVVAHLVADAATPMGVRPLAPLSDRRWSLDLTRASNPVANIASLACGGTLAVGAAWLGRWVAV